MNPPTITDERALAIVAIVELLPRLPEAFVVSLAAGIRERFDPTWQPEVRIVPASPRKPARPA